MWGAQEGSNAMGYGRNDELGWGVGIEWGGVDVGEGVQGGARRCVCMGGSNSKNCP